jgi:hypothetical protein
MVGVAVGVLVGSGVGGITSVRVGVRVGRGVLVGTRVAVAVVADVGEMAIGVAVGLAPIVEHAQRAPATIASALLRIQANPLHQLTRVFPSLPCPSPLPSHTLSDYTCCWR